MRLSKVLLALFLGSFGSLLWSRDRDVVLVTLDTFRADRLAAWGAQASPAPPSTASPPGEPPSPPAPPRRPSPFPPTEPC